LRTTAVAPTLIPTTTELVDRFLASHEVDSATTKKLSYKLKHATRAFGDTRIDQLRTPDLAAWRATFRSVPGTSSSAPSGRYSNRR
jgi:hypothetical protein